MPSPSPRASRSRRFAGRRPPTGRGLRFKAGAGGFLSCGAEPPTPPHPSPLPTLRSSVGRLAAAAPPALLPQMKGIFMSERNTVVRTPARSRFGGVVRRQPGRSGRHQRCRRGRPRREAAPGGGQRRLARWTPVNLARDRGARGRRRGRRFTPTRAGSPPSEGWGRPTAAKLALTGAALAVTAYSRVQGKKLQEAGMVPVEGATEPSADTPADVASAQRAAQGVSVGHPGAYRGPRRAQCRGR